MNKSVENIERFSSEMCFNFWHLCNAFVLVLLHKIQFPFLPSTQLPNSTVPNDILIFWTKIYPEVKIKFLIISSSLFIPSSEPAPKYVPGSFTERQNRPSVITASISASFDNSILQVK